MRRQKDNNGFTLIELMIVVAIIALLAGLALPSYQEQQRKTRRADAKAALLGLAQAMESHAVDMDRGNGSYQGAAGSKDNPQDEGKPWIYHLNPENNNHYDLRIQEADAHSYVLVAIPKGRQEGDGLLIYTHHGRKGWDRNNRLTGNPVNWSALSDASDWVW